MLFRISSAIRRRGISTIRRMVVWLNLARQFFDMAIYQKCSSFSLRPLFYNNNRMHPRCVAFSGIHMAILDQTFPAGH